jgi:hypothetical protein
MVDKSIGLTMTMVGLAPPVCSAMIYYPRDNPVPLLLIPASETPRHHDCPRVIGEQ